MRKDLQGGHRTEAQLREHYTIEKELAARLRNASKEERGRLYSSLYDELYRRVPLHPQVTTRSSPALTARAVGRQMRLVGPLLTKESTFLELGSGTCALSLEISKRVKQVYAVDVSAEIAGSPTLPDNFHLLISDGCTVPVPPGSVDVAYSHQLMEHLHPDDVLEQLVNIYTALAPGGVYMCVTPNRLSGPHDISQSFDSVATGFHLKEYTVEELRRLFRRTEFSKVRVYVGARGRYLKLPPISIVPCERFLRAMPPATGSRIARSLPFRVLLGICIVAMK